MNWAWFACVVIAIYAVIVAVIVTISVLFRD